jgi:hypothetical protein
VVVIKKSIFWYVMLCSPSKVNQHSNGTSPTSSGSKSKPSRQQAQHFPPECQLTFNGLHGIIFHKAEILKNTVNTPLTGTYWEQTLVQTSENPNYRSATVNMFTEDIKWLHVFLGNTIFF